MAGGRLGRCSIRELELRRGVVAPRLESPTIALSLKPAKGGDIVALEYRRRSIDVLWKTPWGPRLPALGPVADDTFSAWIDACPGGWQTLFPNGGAACSVGGALLGFHGEVSTAAWDIDEIKVSDDCVEVALSLRLARSPFRIARRIRLDSVDPLHRSRAHHQ